MRRPLPRGSHTRVWWILLALVPWAGIPTEATASGRGGGVEVDAWVVAETLKAGDVRILVLGDSFATPTFSRVFPRILVEGNLGPLIAIAGGATPNSQLVQGVASVGTELVQAEFGYDLLRSGGPLEFFALPVRGIQEAWLEPGQVEEGEELFRVHLWSSSFRDRGRPFVRDGETVRIRPLVWTPSSPSDLVPSVQIAGPGAESVDVSIVGLPGRISALPDLDVVPPKGAARIPLRYLATDDLAANGGYFHPAGAVFSRLEAGAGGTRLPGLYYSYLADASWSYVGFAADRPAGSASDKTFSVQQLAAWLEATTLDPLQPLLVFVFLAAEPVGIDGGEAVLEAIVDQTATAAVDAGLEGDVLHCLVLPPRHAIAGDPDRTDLFVAQREAMFRVAHRREDVAAISLYDLYSGRLLASLLDTAFLHPTWDGAGCFAGDLAAVLDSAVHWSCFVDGFESGDTSAWDAGPSDEPGPSVTSYPPLSEGLR